MQHDFGEGQLHRLALRPAEEPSHERAELLLPRGPAHGVQVRLHELGEVFRKHLNVTHRQSTHVHRHAHPGLPRPFHPPSTVMPQMIAASTHPSCADRVARQAAVKSAPYTLSPDRASRANPSSATVILLLVQ